MPAWAQAAAAAVVFAAGLAAGTSRSVETARGGDAAPAQSSAPVSAATGASTGASEDLAREVARLRSDLAALRSASPVNAAAVTASTPSGAAPSEAAVLARARALIEDSASELRTEMTLRDTQLARAFDLQQRVDRAEINQNIDRVNGQTGAAFRELRQNQEGLAKVVGLSVQPGR
jgi:hypothetical protein